jgi:hypothetical protein
VSTALWVGLVSESIRPSVRFSYEPKLSTDGHALEYSNLEVEYQEETTRPGRRGNVVIGKSKADILKVEGTFATLDIAAVQGKPELYELDVRLHTDALVKSGVDKYKALPYGYADPNKLGEAKQEGVLVSYLQSKLLNDFEVDGVRAVWGDNIEDWGVGYEKIQRNGVVSYELPSIEQQAENVQVIFENFKEKWNSVKTIPAKREEKKFPRKQVRRLYSPLVHQAMQRLRVENTPQF